MVILRSAWTPVTTQTDLEAHHVAVGDKSPGYHDGLRGC